MTSKNKCIDCGLPLHTKIFHNKLWLICKCGNAMPKSEYNKLVKLIKQWKHSKIGSIWNNKEYNS